MTVPSEIARSGPYVGNGVTTSFAYTFRILAAAHLRVTTVDGAGVESVLTLGADYSVTDVGNAAGGSVILTAPLANGLQLVITRNVPRTQETDLENQGAFLAEVIETALDKAIMLIQQGNEVDARTVTLPITSEGVSASLPGVAANTLIGWNADGSALENKIPNDGTVLPALLGSLTTAEITQLLNINATTISAVQWGFLGAMTAQPIETFTEADGRTPVGAWVPFGGQNLSSNWLFANGQNVLRAQWPDLFARYGTVYGVGDGSTSFGLPDLRGRVIAGLDGMGGLPGGNRLAAVLNSTVLGATGGNQVHALTQAQLAGHGHNVNFTRFDPRAPSVSNNPASGEWTVASLDTPPNTTDTSVTGDGQPHLNVQPTMVGNIVIFAGQEVPQT